MTTASARGTRTAALADAVCAAAAGDPVVVRADEGAALVRAAGAVTAADLEVLLGHGNGVLRVAISSARADRLGLAPVRVESTRGHPVPVEAGDAARTLRLLADPAATAREFRRPGRVFPVRIDDGAVLHHAGSAEAAAELLGLAGLAPVGALVECDAHALDGCALDGCALPVVTAGELAERRYRAALRPVTRTRLPTRHGEFEAVAYSEPRTGATVLALVGAAARHRDRVPVRLHHACVIGDTFGSAACDCAHELEEGLRALAAGDCGVLLYLPAEHGQRTALVHSALTTAQQDDAGTGWLAVAMGAILDDLGVVRASGPP